MSRKKLINEIINRNKLLYVHLPDNCPDNDSVQKISRKNLNKFSTKKLKDILWIDKWLDSLPSYDEINKK